VGRERRRADLLFVARLQTRKTVRISVFTDKREMRGPKVTRRTIFFDKRVFRDRIRAAPGGLHPLNRTRELHPMSVEPQHEVTRILLDWSGGDPEAPERLMPFVYDELRRLARAFLAKERGAHTLQPTALVHEAYLRLVDQRSVSWQNRAHFYGIASSMMRRVLIDHARAHAAEKRGGGAVRLSVEDLQVPLEERAQSLVALDEALERLKRMDERKCRVVEMRFFGGLSDEEIAKVLGVTTRTVLRDWKKARLWLLRELTATTS
jgi:RNA polymerase sigma factor (TIGR02999 family)